MEGNRMRSGGLSLASRRGVCVMRLENWSSRMFQVTFGNWFENSSASACWNGNPVSK